MMFSFSAPAGRRHLVLCFGALWLVVAPICDAQTTLTWSTPRGSVTLFGSGARTTYLQTTALLDGVDGADSLNYLDALSAPVQSKSEAIDGSKSFTTLAQLSVNESQDGGLPFTSGSIGFTSTGGALGSGTGLITLYFLINVPSPMMIDLSEIRSAITTTGSPSAVFSLAMYQSDASGAKNGSALLSFSGNLFDAGASYQSSLPYYLVEMNVAANAAPGAVDAVEFSFLLDLQTITAVPEPATAPLLIVALLGGAVYQCRRVARERKPSP
jgi:hypothetical protein